MPLPRYIYIYIYRVITRTPRNTYIQRLPKQNLHCLICFLKSRDVTLMLKFEHVAMPLRTATRSIAIGNEKLQSCTTSADTSAGEVSLLVPHNNAHIADSKGRRVYDLTANDSLSAARQVLLAVLRITLLGREVSTAETFCLAFGTSLVKCVHRSKTNPRQRKLSGFDKMAGRTRDANG